jgi:hypothetical protein
MDVPEDTAQESFAIPLAIGNEEHFPQSAVRHSMSLKSTGDTAYSLEIVAVHVNPQRFIDVLHGAG